MFAAFQMLLGARAFQMLLGWIIPDIAGTRCIPDVFGAGSFQMLVAELGASRSVLTKLRLHGGFP